MKKPQTWPAFFRYFITAFIIFFLVIFNQAFITPLLIGGIFAIVSYPIYKYFQKRIKFLPTRYRNHTASAVTITLITISFIIILNIAVSLIARELPSITNNIVEFTSNLSQDQTLNRTLQSIGIPAQTSQIAGDYLNSQITQLTSTLGVDSRTQTLDQETVRNILNWGSGAVRVFANQLVFFIIFLLAWHSSTVSGSTWLKEFFALTPFSSAEEKQIRQEVKAGVQNIIYANLMSGIIHASVVFLMMLLFGINNIFILTILTFLIGILPLSPSEFGYIIPIALIFNRNPLLAIFLAGFAELVILWVNYVLTPKIIASSQEINQVLILTSILSGIAIFGIMGFIIGPLIMLLVQTLFEILRKHIPTQQK